ncbi:hypothetical protein QC764_0068110 [Podospora pseudoanserina]|uniref:Uncharacterized protein n=1 Tax=Podospora pseudoanserina TaxID=2609844 RepID=A0ABR0I9Y1_9PEZI|nr:hypothetical protein QC764_0068110 [Podospora pseudoanserina]
MPAHIRHTALSPWLRLSRSPDFHSAICSKVSAVHLHRWTIHDSARLNTQSLFTPAPPPTLPKNPDLTTGPRIRKQDNSGEADIGELGQEGLPSLRPPRRDGRGAGVKKRGKEPGRAWPATTLSDTLNDTHTERDSQFLRHRIVDNISHYQL